MSQTDTLQPRKSPAQSRSQQMVEDLMQATARVLIAEGYDKVSTNRIAKAAGVSVGSLYQYFPNKDALVLALARRHADDMVGMLIQNSVALAHAPIERAVPVFVASMFAAHRVDPKLHIALTYQILHVGIGVFEEIHATSVAIVRNWLEQHRERLVPTDLDTAAWLCVTTVDAGVHAALLDANPTRLTDPSTERELCAMVLRYLLGDAAAISSRAHPSG